MALNIGSAVAFLELDTSKFTKGLSSAGRDLKVFLGSTAPMEKRLGALQSSLQKTGSMLTKGVTLPLVGVGVASAKVASDFEQGMAEVQAISGATAQELVDLKEKAIEMGAKTKFSAKESAEAFKYMAMAGWDTEDMLDGISGIMDLAAASGEDLALTSDIVTDSLTAFGLAAKDSTHFADVLARASSRSNTNVALMGETFKYVAPVAGALGYSVEDTAVAIGLMANAGIKGSQAGTTLRQVFTRLAKPTDQVADAMEQLGLSIVDAEGNVKPLSVTMQDLRTKFAGLTDAEKAQYAATIAGQEGMSGLLAIINASDEDFAKLTEEINNADGASKEMAETMMNTTSGAIEQLKGALESAGIIIGNKLTPYIKKLAEFITTLIEKFNSLSEEQQDNIVKWGLIAAAVGPVLLVLSKVIGMLKGIVTAVKVVSKVVQLGFKPVLEVFAGISPVVAAVAAVIMVLVGAFKHLWETSEEFRNKMTEIFESVKQSISGFIEAVKTRLEPLKGVFEKVTGAISTIWDGFCQLLAPVFVGAFSIIANTIDYVLNLIVGFVDIVTGFFTGDWETLWQGVQEVFGAVWEFISQTITDVGTMFSDLLNVVLSPFGITWQEIWEAAKQVFSDVWETIITFATETIPQFIQSVIEWFKDLPHNIGVVVGEMIGHIYNFGASALQWVQTELPTIIQGIIDWFQELPGKIWEFLCDVVEYIVQWGSDMVESGKQAAQDFINKCEEVVKELPDKIWDIIVKIPEKVKGIGEDLRQAGSEIFNKLWEGIKSIGESILGWVSDFAGSISGFISGIIEGFNSVISKAGEAGGAVSAGVGAVVNAVNGSHRNGLSFVPFDGYVARLHQGERVLTKQQNEEYNEGRDGKGDTYNFYNVKPDPYEYAKQMKRARQEEMYGF